MPAFINRKINILQKKENDFMYTKFNDALKKILPNTKYFYRPITCLHRHYNITCITMESCSNYITNTYPNYIQNAHLEMYKLNMSIQLNKNKIEESGFNKEILIISLYNQQIAEREIQIIKNILWYLKRNHVPVSTIGKAISFMEFYESRYPHPIRKNYREILSEYL